MDNRRRYSTPRRQQRRHTPILGLVAGIVVVVALIAAIIGWRLIRSSDSNGQPGQAKPAASQSGRPAAATFDKTRYSPDNPASLWIIVNKRRPLQPATYQPVLSKPNVGLRLSADTPEMQVSSQAAGALEKLFAAAKQDGLSLIIASAYRSYQDQVSVYGNEIKNYGQATADRESARPGYSEHQTGLAVDVGSASRQCEVQACFGSLPEGQWVAANAYKYGFIVRYGQSQESVTGYTYEPWHLRYVGNELAAEIQRQGNPPLETFFGLGAAADYR